MSEEKEQKGTGSQQFRKAYAKTYTYAIRRLGKALRHLMLELRRVILEAVKLKGK